MNKPRKPSRNVQLFEKEVKRLQKFITIGKHKGLVFIESPIPEKPKRVTKQNIRKLQETTLSQILSKGYEINEETGELTQYKPLKESRARKISTPSFTNNPYIAKPTVTKTPERLTPEQLKEVRSRAAKKAAETRRKRMREDPEYRKRMQEIWKRAGQKASETRKRREALDPEYKKRMDEIRRKNLEKAREARRKKYEDEDIDIPVKQREYKEPEEPEEPKPEIEPNEPEIIEPEEPEEPSLPKHPKSSKDKGKKDKDYESYKDEAVDEWRIVLQVVTEKLMTCHNNMTAQFLLDRLQDEITEAGYSELYEDNLQNIDYSKIEELGRQRVGERLAQSSESAIELADECEYASTNEQLRDCSSQLLTLIIGKNPDFSLYKSLTQCCDIDIPPKTKVYGSWQW